MAPSTKDKSTKTGAGRRRSSRTPPEGETLDGLLHGAAHACRERGRGETAETLERLAKKDSEKKEDGK